MRLERKLVAGAATLLLAGGGTGVAIAAAGQGAGSYTAPRAAHARTEAKSLIEVAAAYLRVDVKTLSRELNGGKTLAQLAGATEGRSEKGLTRTLLVHANGRLKVVAGPMSGAKLATIRAWLERRMTGFVNGTCSLKLGTLFRRLGGSCPGMSM